MSKAAGYYQAHDPAAAAGVCREILLRQPAHADANHLLAIIHSQAGDQEEAVRCVAKAIAARSRNPHYYNTLGNALHKLGRNPEAIDKLREALRLDPHYTEAWNTLGLALQGNGELEEAIRSYRRGLVLDPRHARCHNSLGNALAAGGQLDAALEAYTSAIDCDAGYHEAYGNRGNVMKLLGRERNALADYDRAIALAPNDLAAINNRALMQLQGGGHADALPALVAAAARHPGDLATVTHLGVAYAGLRRYDEALAVLDAVLARNDGFGRAHFFRGHVLRAIGRQEDALAGYLRAIHCDPDQPDAYDGLAFTLLDTGRHHDLSAIIDGLDAESRLSAAHRGGLHVLRAIAAWVGDDPAACRADIDIANAAAAVDEPYPNAAMIGIYRRYLTLLLDYRGAHAEAYGADGAAELHVVGESHCLSPAWTRVSLDGIPHRVRPHLVMGAKAWHFAAPGPSDHKQNLARAITGLPEGGQTLFVFGEIDTRLDEGVLRHVDRHPRSDWEQVALVTALGYVTYVARLARTRGLKVSFQGVPAPAASHAGVEPERRTRHLELVRFFNAALETLAGDHGCRYVDVFGLSAGADGSAHRRSHLDAYHLTPDCLGQALRPSRRAGEAGGAADNSACKP